MLWLIGMMGSGKSSVGALLASATSLPLIDTDELVEQRSGETIRELFAQGERVFREWERLVITAVADGQPAIVATGGGAVLANSNRYRMKEGTVVWLQAAVDELARRVDGSESRPLLSEGTEALPALLRERDPVYAELADIVVETDGCTQAQVVQAILDVWQR